MRTIHVHISGRVQGVGYRAWFAAHARDLGLTGWVRNRREGSVEAAVQGSGKAIEALQEMCWQGPRHARVSAVDTVEADEAAFGDFRIRDTV